MRFFSIEHHKHWQTKAPETFEERKAFLSDLFKDTTRKWLTAYENKHNQERYAHEPAPEYTDPYQYIVSLDKEWEALLNNVKDDEGLTHFVNDILKKDAQSLFYTMLIGKLEKYYLPRAAVSLHQPR